MAEALLYGPQTLEAHEALFASAFASKAPVRAVRLMAGRAFAWTTHRPQPRIMALAKKLAADRTMQRLMRKHPFQPTLVPVERTMRVWPGLEALPRIETVGQLATWLQVDTGYLQWMADPGDRNRRQSTPALQHYSVRCVSKSDGSCRLIEAPKQHLRHVQRQILREILNPVPLHDAVHGFRKGRSIVSFAEPHAGRACVLRLDLREFFPTISGPRVQGMFRTLGYPEHVADLLGALCTTTTPDAVWRGASTLDHAEAQRLRTLYRRPHLPQGAPSSPALANICALRLDRRLTGLAAAAGAAYTRYADDLAFSGEGSFARDAERFSRHVAAVALEEGFYVQHRKTRLMRRLVRQHVGGLTVNARPAVPRRDLEQLEATLTNCVRHGPESQNRMGHRDFRAYLAGKVAFVAMVRPDRAQKLRALLQGIVWP